MSGRMVKKKISVTGKCDEAFEEEISRGGKMMMKRERKGRAERKMMMKRREIRKRKWRR